MHDANVYYKVVVIILYSHQRVLQTCSLVNRNNIPGNPPITKYDFGEDWETVVCLFCYFLAPNLCCVNVTVIDVIEQT